MKLESMYYVKVFVGNISAGQVVEEFAAGLYVCNAIDTEVDESPKYIQFNTLNDFITGGYVFFETQDEAATFIDKTKKDVKELEEKAKQKQKELEEQAVQLPEEVK